MNFSFRWRPLLGVALALVTLLPALACGTDPTGPADGGRPLDASRAEGQDGREGPGEPESGPHDDGLSAEHPPTGSDAAVADVGPGELATPDSGAREQHGEQPDRDTVGPDRRSSCGPCRVLHRDSLASKKAIGGQASGGQFTGGGWRSTGWDTRIVYDLRRKVDCGRIRVDISDLNPPAQYKHKREPVDCSKVDCYVHLLAAFEASHGNQHKAVAANESQLEVQATAEGSWRDRKLKLKAGPCAAAGCKGGTQYGVEQNWSRKSTYQLEVRWSPAEVVLFIDGKRQAGIGWKWPAGQPPRPGLRYLFLGRDKNGGGGYLKGPIYSNAVVSVCD